MAIAERSGTKYMWVGGEFTQVNGAPQRALTRFASTGDVGAPTTPVASVSSVGPGEVQVRWRAGLRPGRQQADLPDLPQRFDDPGRHRRRGLPRMAA